MSHYLLTGAAGFIGSRVAAELLARGHSVVGVDNLNSAYDPLLKQWRLEQLRATAGFDFVELDVGDRESVNRLSALHSRRRFEGVLNLAARAGVRFSLVDPWAYYETNVVGTLNLLEFCRAGDIRKFVLASTSSLYGRGRQPFREDSPTDCPLSPYAATKKAAEALCHTYHHLYGLDVTVFRYFTVYGPAGRPDMSPFRFVQWIAEGREVEVFGDGTQSRDFTFVDDVARGTVEGLRPLGFEVFNLGSDRPVVLMDLIRRIETLTGQKAKLFFRPPHPADVQATWADIAKARRMLGWHPGTDFEAGTDALVRWYFDNREWAGSIVT